jgi:hypothetical protein
LITVSFVRFGHFSLFSCQPTASCRIHNDCSA